MLARESFIASSEFAPIPRIRHISGCLGGGCTGTTCAGVSCIGGCAGITCAGVCCGGGLDWVEAQPSNVNIQTELNRIYLPVIIAVLAPFF